MDGVLSLLFFVCLALLPVLLGVLIVKGVKKRPLKCTAFALAATAALASAVFVWFGLNVCKHQFELVEQTASTCTQDGFALYRCALCGQEKTEVEKAFGHKMEETLYIGPTRLEDGKVVEVCTICGHERVEILKREQADIADAGGEAGLTGTDAAPGVSESAGERGGGKEEEAGGDSESESPEEKNNAAKVILTRDGFTIFACPLDGGEESLIFSDNRFDIVNLALESHEEMPWGRDLVFTGRLKNHSGRDWEAIGLTFCLLDENDELLTEMDAGFAVVGTSMEYLCDGEERDFSFSVTVTPYIYDHMEQIGLSGLTCFG